MSCERHSRRQWAAGTFGILLSLTLIGCFSTSAVSPTNSQSQLPQSQQLSHESSQQVPSSDRQTPTSPQKVGLPFRASDSDVTPKAFAKIADQTIYLEVAQTPQEQARGLMNRTTLADDRGMLFPFNPPQPVGFWMKHVPISLDIIFLQAGKVVKIAANLPPCTRSSCPVYPSEAPVDQVIELRGGRAAELGLKSGDSVLIQLLPPVKTEPQTKT